MFFDQLISRWIDRKQLNRQLARTGMSCIANVHEGQRKKVLDIAEMFRDATVLVTSSIANAWQKKRKAEPIEILSKKSRFVPAKEIRPAKWETNNVRRSTQRLFRLESVRLFVAITVSVRTYISSSSHGNQSFRS